MSRPHSTKELSFTKHRTKPATYIPGKRKADHVLAWFAIALGAAILGYAAFLITRSL